MELETLAHLKKSYENLDTQIDKRISFLFQDTHGNAVPMNSTGHLHRPCHTTPWKWASLVERLLEITTFGLKNNLQMSVTVYRRAALPFPNENELDRLS